MVIESEKNGALQMRRRALGIGAPAVMSSSAGSGSVSLASKYGPPGSSFSVTAAAVPSSAASPAASQPSGGGTHGMPRAPARAGGVVGGIMAAASASALGE